MIEKFDTFLIYLKLKRFETLYVLLRETGYYRGLTWKFQVQPDYRCTLVYGAISFNSNEIIQSLV